MFKIGFSLLISSKFITHDAVYILVKHWLKTGDMGDCQLPMDKCEAGWYLLKPLT